MRRITAASDERRISGSVYARPRGEIVLAVQAHADAGGDAAAAAGALVGRRLRDLLDLQQRRLVAQRIALDAREPGVDHVADAGHRQRGLGDVGREHDAPPAARREHALLLGDREPRVERQDLDAAAYGRRARPAPQQVGGLADLALAGQEHEDVARPLAPEVLGGGDDRVLELLLVVGLLAGAVFERPVAHARPGYVRPDTSITGAGAAAVDCAKCAREALGVDRGRRDDRP